MNGVIITSYGYLRREDIKYTEGARELTFDIFCVDRVSRKCTLDFEYHGQATTYRNYVRSIIDARVVRNHRATSRLLEPTYLTCVIKRMYDIEWIEIVDGEDTACICRVELRRDISRDQCTAIINSILN